MGALTTSQSQSPSAINYGSKSLGRLIATRRLPKAAAIVGLIAGVAFFAAGAFYLTREPGAGVIALAVGAFPLIAALYVLTAKFEIRENGATSQSLFGHRAVSFDELKTFRFARLRVGAESQVEITLIPGKGKPVRLVAKPSGRNAMDSHIEALSEKLAVRIASKMKAQLSRTGKVAWMPRVAGSIPPQPAIGISRDGYVISNGHGDRNLLFSEVVPELSNGFFFLRHREDNKVLFQATAAAPNFYPGWKLIAEFTAADAYGAERVCAAGAAAG